MSDLFRAEEIGKKYRGHTVLEGASFSPERGSVFGLLGPNGSGKSTTLHISTGLTRATSGRVLISGRPVADKSTRHRMGFAPDDLPMPGALTGGEYLTMHDRLRGRDDRVRAARLCEALGVEDALRRMISEYSHGMKRKLQLVAATMHRPDVLFLDEPFRGLDPEAAAALRQLMALFTQHGGVIVVATHDMLRAERDCQEVLVLHHGSTVAQGAPSDLRVEFGEADLEGVFLAATGHPVRAGRRHGLMTDAFST